MPSVDLMIESAHPLDVVEEIVTANEWTFDRLGADELSVTVAGGWCEYQLGFSYSESQGALQIACAYDMRIARHKFEAVYLLLGLINERMWLGHFDLWAEEAMPMFRHAVLIGEGQGPTARQVEELIDIALHECERFYPAFQFVLWGGKTPAEAVEAAMLETVGEA